VGECGTWVGDDGSEEAVTPELKAAVQSLGLDGKGLAAIIGVGEDTISGWGYPKRRRGTLKRRGITPTPVWVWHLVRAWRDSPAALREAVARTHGELMPDRDD
jgi:hypothetical protein